MAKEETPLSQETASKARLIPYAYVIVVAAFLITIIMGGTLYSYGVFIKPLEQEFHWSRAAVSGAKSLAGVLSGLLAIVIGRLDEKLGPRLVMTASGLFLGLGYLLMSRISALWQLYLFCGVHVPRCCYDFLVTLMAMIARWFVKRRSTFSGLVLSAIGVGTVSLPMLAERIIANYSWRAACLVFGIMFLLVVTISAQFLRRNPAEMGLLPYGAAESQGTENEKRNSSTQTKSQDLTFNQAMRTKQFWMICVMYFLYMLALTTIMVHIVPYATGLGINPISAASILSVMAVILVPA